MSTLKKFNNGKEYKEFNIKNIKNLEKNICLRNEFDAFLIIFQKLRYLNLFRQIVTFFDNK